MAGWLQSEKAFKLFLYSAWIVVCMGIFMAFMWTPWFQQIELSRAGDIILRVLVAPLAVAGPFAALILLFGMVEFCLRHDKSPASDKILWFIAFFFTACFGAALYFFVIYRKRVRGLAWPV